MIMLRKTHYVSKGSKMTWPYFIHQVKCWQKFYELMNRPMCCLENVLLRCRSSRRSWALTSSQLAANSTQSSKSWLASLAGWRSRAGRFTSRMQGAGFWRSLMATSASNWCSRSARAKGTRSACRKWMPSELCHQLLPGSRRWLDHLRLWMPLRESLRLQMITRRWPSTWPAWSHFWVWMWRL